MNEVWKPIVGYEGLYEISSLGKVRSTDREVRGKRYKSKNLRASFSGRYLKVDLYHEGKRETRTIHSLVVEAFVGIRPEGKLVRHLDGDITNNVISNLSYGTNSENMMDRIAHGTSGKQVRRSDGKVYPTINSAAEDNSVGRTSISQALRKGYRAAGFHWELVS